MEYHIYPRFCPASSATACCPRYLHRLSNDNLETNEDNLLQLVLNHRKVEPSIKVKMLMRYPA